MANTVRADQLMNNSTTPIIPSKPLPLSTTPTAKASKPTVIAPRIDVEPLYTALHSALGIMDWAIYKESISLFVLGSLNQKELDRRIQPFIGIDAQRAHLHNHFIAAILGNLSRDPPEAGVATWVSANDKPTAAVKPASGDGGEQRLKTEIKNLTGRERRRLKQIQEDPFDMFTQTMTEYHRARSIRAPEVGPSSAGGFTNTSNKTNIETEIKKRYNQPLYSETNEFPDSETIQARMVPICYEEGLVNGCAAGCADFVETATEFYIKEVLSSFFSRVSSNGENFVRTGNFKRQVEKEEDAWLRGEVTKNAAGLLPVEVEENTKRAPLSMDDLRLALQLGDPFLGQVPLISGQIYSHGWSEQEADGSSEKRNSTSRTKSETHPMVNGNSHGINGDAMDVDEADYSWQGATSADMDIFHSMLDDVLAVGD